MSTHAEEAWFELVPQAMIEFDERGFVLRSNIACRRLLGESSNTCTASPTQAVSG